MYYIGYKCSVSRRVKGEIVQVPLTKFGKYYLVRLEDKTLEVVHEYDIFPESHLSTGSIYGPFIPLVTTYDGLGGPYQGGVMEKLSRELSPDYPFRIVKV